MVATPYGDCRERRAGHQQHAHPPAGGATGDDADRQHQHRQIARGVERAERTIHLRQRIVGRHLFDHRQPQHGVQPEEQQHAIDHGGESARQPLRVAQISQPQQQRGVAECVEHGDGEWRYARDAGLATEDEQEPGRRPEGDRTTDESPRAGLPRVLHRDQQDHQRGDAQGHHVRNGAGGPGRERAGDAEHEDQPGHQRGRRSDARRVGDAGALRSYLR